METRLGAWILETPEGRKADEILRSCVHCGFCLATCPTYQLLGDELDSPRGRIYQIKQVLEGAPPTRETQLHLDRCLTCRSCETTCPSGVRYGELVDIGRAAVAERVDRPLHDRVYRWLLREGVSRAWLFGAALTLARSVRWALPSALRARVPAVRPSGVLPKRTHSRRVLLLNNCVQPSLCPSIDAATARVLDALGVQSMIVRGSGCCGAIRQHLDDHAGARAQFRRNIDAWWPFIESAQVEAIVMNASGCGAMVKEYAQLLRDDRAYAHKARRVVELTEDLAEFLPRLMAEPSRNTGPRGPTPSQRRIAFHSPCTLQHALKIRGNVEAVLVSLGAKLVPVGDAHLCCGSAGTYSLLQPKISRTLRGQKLDSLLQSRPEVVLSANIGCIAHLQSATDTPVRHWIEWVDEALRPPQERAAWEPTA
jgi:glycolate oxidase iron-sulfur subunit